MAGSAAFKPVLLLSTVYRLLEFNWWSRGGSNSWPPHCERGALPTELLPHATPEYSFEFRVSSLRPGPLLRTQLESYSTLSVPPGLSRQFKFAGSLGECFAKFLKLLPTTLRHVRLAAASSLERFTGIPH